MASQWYTLVTQKLFLAKQLAGESAVLDSAPRREASLQGATELALRARKLMLVMIARFYQHKQAEPDSLEALSELLGETAPELAELEALARQAGSWWNHLDQLEKYQNQPPEQKKTVSSENIIAIAAGHGPDRSTDMLDRTLDSARHYAETLEERHSEW